MWSGIALAAILAMGMIGLLAFDWNRIKPWINARVSEATGRPFAIHGDLSLTWQAPQGEQGWRAWVPWPRLNAQNVTFGNPAWARQANMAEARQITFSIYPLPLLNKRIVILSLSLDAPRLALERRQDGRNNWSFGSDETSRSEWRLDLQRLILNKGTVHVVDAVKRADLKADLDTLDADNSKDYRIGWRLNGTFNGEQVDGKGRAGAVLALQKRHVRFPLEVKVRVGKTAINAQGTLTDPRQPSALDLKLHISGVSMAHLYPLIGVVLPDTPPFTTEGRLVGTWNALGGNWAYEKFSGKVGASDLSGTLRYQGRRPRALLEGEVVSNYLNFNDLSPLVGADSNESKVLRGADVRQPADKALPVETFRTERWTAIDADVQFTGRRIVRRQELPVENLVTHVRLRNGVLSLAPLKFGVAGGNIVSDIRLNGNREPIEAELTLSARHLQLGQLFPTLLATQSSLGEINGDAALSATGNSVAALLGSSNGEIKAMINQGTVSKLFLEQIGLNIGSIVVTQLFGDRQVKIHCAIADFAVENGVLRTRAFVVDTEEARIYMTGDVNLAREQLALRIHPESKGVRLISLRSPLYLNGPFKQPEVGVDKGMLALKAGSAVALGVLAPVAAALIPLVNLGSGEESECGSLLAQATGKPVAPAAEKGRAKASRK